MIIHVKNLTLHKMIFRSQTRTDHTGGKRTVMQNNFTSTHMLLLEKWFLIIRDIINFKIQALTNLMFACSDFRTRKMVLRTSLCTQNYVCIKQSLWALIYIV